MMHLLGKVFFLIVSLVAINVGTAALFNFNVFSMLPLNLVTPVSVIVGIIGVVSLVMFFYMGHCGVHEEERDHNNVNRL